ncbi:MAG: response regulator, partial [Microcoleus sp.]
MNRNKSTRTILIIDDSPEDRELYLRYMRRDRENSYIFLEAALGKQGLEMLLEQQPDVVLLDYRLPDLDGLELLARLKFFLWQSCLPIIMVTGQGNEKLAVQAMKAGAQDYLVKEQITPEGLQLTVNRVIENVLLQSQLQQRIQLERLVSQISRKIHQTMNLKEILQEIVTETRLFLQADRVFLYHFLPDFSGMVAVESVGENWLSVLNLRVAGESFSETPAQSDRGGIQAVADIYTADLTDDRIEMLAQFQIRANLAIPIRHGEALWGLLIVNQCSAPRQWQQLEIDLCQELTVQIGIALKQAELYQAEQALRESVQREKAIATVIERMRATLDMEMIFRA